MAGLVVCFSTTATAQRDVVLSKNIASLQVVAGNRWLSMPIINIKDGTPINIHFDDITNDYHSIAKPTGQHQKAFSTLTSATDLPMATLLTATQSRSIPIAYTPITNCQYPTNDAG